ncbi:MAG TPA: hypothetical protein VGR73_22740 [Bryobacteraceae bacterium]|nr:hypothetical protein [Bryobacteraceae bacterium]
MKDSGDLITALERSDRGDSEEFFEMANLFPKHTGLPFVVWISYKGGAQHDVRVKVSPGPKTTREKMASVAIRPKVRVVGGDMSAGDLALLTKWVELNRGVLLKYWEGEIDTKDALDSIRIAE